MNRIKTRKLLYIIPIILIVFIMLYIYKYYLSFGSTDSSSELLLAKVLNNNKSIMSTEWYYSTEIKFINTNIVFAPLFSIFNDWLIVRTIGSGICLALMVFSALYLYKQLEIKNNVVLLCLMLFPLSTCYFDIYISHPHYEFSSIKTYLTIGLLIDLLKNDKNKVLKICLLSVLCIIQVSEGLRNTILTIIPIVLLYIILEFINVYKKIDIRYKQILKKYRRITIVILISSFIGGLLYIYFSTKYSFQHFVNLKFINLNIESILDVVVNLLKIFGYTNSRVFSTALIHNGLAILLLVMTIVVIISNIKNASKINFSVSIYTCVVLVALLIMIGIALFTDCAYKTDRHYVPVTVLIIPLIYDWVQNKTSQHKLTKYLLVLVIFIYVLCGIDNFRINKNKNNLIELSNITNKLEEDGYSNGYSYYWNGNTITELSNGKIDMWVLGHGTSTCNAILDLDKIYEWLQLKNHQYTKPGGKIFLIFNEDELKCSQILNKLDTNKIIYKSAKYTVFGYNNRNELDKDFYD